MRTPGSVEHEGRHRRHEGLGGSGQAARTERIRPDRGSIGQAIRRVVAGGVLGALPGLVIALVPLLLHDLGVISGDQSQIGFIGLPLLVIGTSVGAAVAASDRGCEGVALLGAAAGFLVGVAAGATIGAILTGLAGIWLFLMPLGMIGGAALATALRLRRADEPPAR